jgi:hypothetical protein
MNPNEEMSIEKLHDEYFQLLGRQIPQRVKGIPYQKIIGPSGLTWLFLTFFVCPFITVIFRLDIVEDNMILLVVYVVFTCFFLLLPGMICDEGKRTARHAKRYYPHIYKKNSSLAERRKGEAMVPGLPVLNVEGNSYYLSYYVIQHKWKRNPNPEITGYVVANNDGEWLIDEEIFTKAFLTYNFGLIGAVSGQNIAITERLYLAENIKIYLPRSEKVLKMQRTYFKGSGHLNTWQALLDLLPGIYAAGKDGLTIFDGRERFRKSIGYSFGYEFLYEDAVQEQQMRQVFCKYMLAAHFKTIDSVRVLAAHLHEDVKNQSGFGKKQIAMKALKQIWNFAFTLSTLIQRMSEQGTPSARDRKLFVDKTFYARKLDLQNKA